MYVNFTRSGMQGHSRLAQATSSVSFETIVVFAAEAGLCTRAAAVVWATSLTQKRWEDVTVLV